MQAARDERIEKEVSLDALKQVEMDAILPHKNLCHPWIWQGERVNVNVVPMFIFLLRDGKSQIYIYFFSVIKCYAPDRHCRFTAVHIQFEPDTSYLSKVA